MDPIETIIEDEEEVPIVLMPAFPGYKYHGPPLHFLTRPAMTKAEYERKIWSCQINFEADDIISVSCPDTANGPRWFHVKRSILQRSPTLANFFKSDHYVPGCNMVIEFLVDPAVCFEIVEKYLEQGVDVFKPVSLLVSLTMRYKIVDRCLVLSRLHLLAGKLTLPGLAKMAFEVLVSVEKLVDASVTLTISSLIFGKKWCFDDQLKDWCFKHVSTHLLELKQMPEWRECLRKTDHELSKRWGVLTDKNAYLINTAEAAAEQKFVEGLARDMPYVSTEPSDRKHRSEETVRGVPLIQQASTQLLTGRFSAGLESDRLAADEPVTENDEDWDENSSKNAQSSNTTTSFNNTSNNLPLSIPGKEPNIEKLQRLLGVDQNSTDEIRKQEPWLNLSPVMGEYPGLSSPKARAVLGISPAHNLWTSKEVHKSSVSTPTKMKAKVRAWRNSASSGGSGSSGRSGLESLKSVR
ncbi:MAG: hypothetical protein Q9167_004681 [Letrouitia subvulpina]